MRLFILLALMSAGVPTTQTPAPPHPVSHVSAAPTPFSPNALFSRSALRRARLLIQMRMLELRGEKLERVHEAILRRLPPDLQPPDPDSTPTPPPN